MKKTTFSILTIAILAACVPSEEKDLIKMDDKSTAESALLVRTAALDDSICANGGVALEMGVDQNSNSIVDDDEVTEVKVVCQGETGYDSLIRLVYEPAGDNCISGGKVFSTGKDVNYNDELDASEVDNTQYICNGLDGGVQELPNVDNRAVFSIHCFGGLEGEPSIFAAYNLVQFNSGDVIASASIRNGYIEISKSEDYSIYQAGFTSAPVGVTFDMAGAENGGWWRVSLDRESLITSIAYNDFDYGVSGTFQWYWTSDECIINDYTD